MISNRRLCNLFYPVQHNKSLQLSIELLDTENESNSGQDEAAEVEKWTNYVDSYITETKPPLAPAAGGEEGKLGPLASSEAALLSLIGSGGINSDVSDDLRDHLKKKPIFLSRNIRKWRSR
jgi:hypothetical protein